MNDCSGYKHDERFVESDNLTLHEIFFKSLKLNRDFIVPPIEEAEAGTPSGIECGRKSQKCVVPNKKNVELCDLKDFKPGQSCLGQALPLPWHYPVRQGIFEPKTRFIDLVLASVWSTQSYLSFT